MESLRSFTCERLCTKEPHAQRSIIRQPKGYYTTPQSTRVDPSSELQCASTKKRAGILKFLETRRSDKHGGA
eukprot:1308563-Amphidinium_carterae.1